MQLRKNLYFYFINEIALYWAKTITCTNKHKTFTNNLQQISKQAQTHIKHFVLKN